MTSCVESPQPQVPVCVITNTAEKPPDTVRPVGVFVKCVDNLDDGTFVGWFGYESSEHGPGHDSRRPPEPGDARRDRPDRQPSTFQQGRVESAFSVTGRPAEDDPLELTTPQVSGAPPTTSEAEADAGFERKCSSPPDPPAPTVDVFVTCVENTGDTYTRQVRIRESQHSVGVAFDRRSESVRPGAQYRGQPEEFLPGRVDVAVVVGGISNSVDLAWTVDTGNGAPGTATARATFGTKCSVEPPPPPPPSRRPGRPPPPPPGPPPPTGGSRADRSLRPVHHDDGATYDAVFGYQNDNAYAVAIPVGSDNRFVPGGDRGRPRRFAGKPPERVHGRRDPEPRPRHVGRDLCRRDALREAGLRILRMRGRAAELKPIGVFACIVDRGDTFDAVFGYENDNPVDISRADRGQNFVLPRPVNRGQPTVLSPGRHESAFTVRGVDSAILAWTVKHEGVAPSS